MNRCWMMVAASTVVLSGAALAETPTPPARPSVVDFNGGVPGSPPAAFETVIGDWYIAEVAGDRGLLIDGGRWRQGVPSANLADQARRLYGERYAEFLDGVKAQPFQGDECP